jgi:hypothetical protein
MTAAVGAARARVRTGIVLDRGVMYDVAATGTWRDRRIEVGPAGYEQGSALQRWVGWLRRAPDRPWFELMGEVGGTVFPIGDRSRVLAPADGELVCWANDVRVAYRNNTGAVQLRVTRPLG